jgi:hypothetical protein
VDFLSGLQGIASSVKNGFATAQTSYTNWLSDQRPTNDSQPRVQSSDPTQSIDTDNRLNLLNFPADRPKYYITFGFEEYRRPTQFKGLSSAGITDYVCLPIPNELNDNNNFEWNQIASSLLMEGVTEIGRAAGSGITESIVTGGLDPLKEAGSAMLSNSGQLITGIGIEKALSVAKSAAKIAGVGGGDKQQGLVDGLMQMGGLAENPFNTIAFGGPNFKTHRFSWMLAPKTRQESEILRQIVYTFKKMAHPELLSMAAGGFFKYPHIVWPKFQPDVLSKNLYTFKPCVIVSCNIEYSPQGAVGFFHDTSAPIRAILHLQLLEIEIWRNGNGEGLVNHMLPRIGNGDFNDPTIQTVPTPSTAPVRDVDV